MCPKDDERAFGRHDATIRDDAPEPVRHDATMRSEELEEIAHALAGRGPQPVIIAPHPAAAARPKLDATLRSGNEGPTAKDLMPPTVPVSEPAKGGPGGTAIMGTAPAQIQALNRELAAGSGPIASPQIISGPITAPRPRPATPVKTGMPWWVGVLIFGGLLLLVGIGVGGFLWWGASNNLAEKELLTSAQSTPCPATYSCKPLEHKKATYQVCSVPGSARYGGGDVVFLTGVPNRLAVVKKVLDAQSYEATLQPSGVAVAPRNDEVIGRVCQPTAVPPPAVTTAEIAPPPPVETAPTQTAPPAVTTVKPRPTTVPTSNLQNGR